MMEEPPPLNYLGCFRIVAWKACVYGELRFELGPKYYCATCLLPEKDLQAQPVACPLCPLTHLYQDVFKDGAADEIEIRGGLPPGHSIEQLISDYMVVAGVLSDHRDRIQADWDVAFVELARIVLQERAQQKFINSWNLWVKMKQTK